MQVCNPALQICIHRDRSPASLAEASLVSAAFTKVQEQMSELRSQLVALHDEGAAAWVKALEGQLVDKVVHVYTLCV